MVQEILPPWVTWEDTSKRFQIPRLALGPRGTRNDSNEPQAADVTAGGGTIYILSSGTTIPVPFTARISSDSEFYTDVSLPTSQAMVLNRLVETATIFYQAASYKVFIVDLSFAQVEEISSSILCGGLPSGFLHDSPDPAPRQPSTHKHLQPLVSTMAVWPAINRHLIGPKIVAGRAWF